MHIRKNTALVLLLLFAVSLALLFVSYRIAYHYYAAQVVNQAGLRATLHRTALAASLERYQHLPYVLAQDPHIQGALTSSDREMMNRRLESFARESKADVIYLMTSAGDTIASSNWQSPSSFVGQNYHFRPYFMQALAGESGQFFAIGATTLKPGYFVAQGVRNKSSDVAGVIAVKVDLRPLEQSWRESGERIFVSNADGIVTLSSVDGWRYKSVAPLSESSIVAIRARRQFAEEPLSPLPISRKEDESVSIAGRRYVESIVDVGYLGWRLHYLSSQTLLTSKVQSVVLAVAGLELLCLLVYVFLRSHRIRNALLLSQKDSLELRELNIALQQEVDERKRAELALHNAQKELQQANKLAVLGQLSASVGHELSQPLSAMKNYLASARIPGEDPQESFNRLDGLVRRMDKITRQLKFFSRKTDDVLSDVNLNEVVDSAIRMLQAQIDESSIVIDRKAALEVIVRGDFIRLEQVIVNLLNNAIDALADVKQGMLTVTVAKTLDEAVVTVADNGHGFSEENLAHIFDPFYTTKPSGKGTGLGLAISSTIIRELGGELVARNADEGGALMTVILPAK